MARRSERGEVKAHLDEQIGQSTPIQFDLCSNLTSLQENHSDKNMFTMSTAVYLVNVVHLQC